MHHFASPQDQHNDAGRPGLVGLTNKPYTSLVECNGTFEGPYPLAYANPPSQATAHASDGRANEPAPDTRSTRQMATAELSAVQVNHATEPSTLPKGVDEVALLHIGAWIYELSRA
ncbi:hypothetical protein MAPG_10865 [Magnaporthiopsis poae ATCC 64411]|uniref:Uncharacterized protein n=1 Tax=Magnaporthiopsis poae (strain ATCC 64411 / 73-15) TaxID=644358 RepID=A0A0C4EDQ7_MAGP6|nr:hypothetical protein MAPG_10865 [Magnaporthiopsis poae ATCC 64411]